MTGSASANGARKNWRTASSAPINWDVYDPNNYMMNPEKYRKPYEMGKTGGWTYNKDWRRNTNFTAEAVGEWQLELTPEVAANWMPDTRRPEMYESFWTPEAVMARYQASVAAAAKTRDSLAALAAIANANTPVAKGRKGSRNDAGMTGSASTGTWAAGGGTTGAVGTGGSAATNNTTASAATSATAMAATTAATTTTTDSSTTNSSVTTPFVMTAVNGNNFKLPTLNMYIDNGSFTAYTGCNNAVGTIVVNGSSLHFDETTPSTNVECIGGFDQAAFLDRLRRADSYDVVNNQFRIKQGEQVLMVFSKPATKTSL